MVSIRVNGSPREVEEKSTVRDLVRALDLERGGIAVEINRAIVPRSTFEERVLVADDQIEIVTIMGGG